MVAETSTQRSEEQLEFILHETANWTVNGIQDVVFCEVPSLRLALEKAAEVTARGREVVALMRGLPPEIVVFSGQLRKLISGLAEARVSPEPCVVAFIDETEIGLDGILSALNSRATVYREATV
jgi:hypothetical protein